MQNFSTAPKKLGADISRPVWSPKPTEFVSYHINLRCDWPGNVRAQFFGRSGKVLHWPFSIVGMACQSQNVNNSIPDDRVARSMDGREHIF